MIYLGQHDAGRTGKDALFLTEGNVLHLDGSGETQTRRYGHPAVPEVLSELDRLHIRKSAGYGSGTDPFANYREVARESGVPDWMPAFMRVIEKKQRLTNWRETTVDVQEELMDIALCAVIALVMLRESSRATSQKDHGLGAGVATGDAEPPQNERDREIARNVSTR